VVSEPAPRNAADESADLWYSQQEMLKKPMENQSLGVDFCSGGMIEDASDHGNVAFSSAGSEQAAGGF
jgi:hypothetical protein